MNSIKDDIGQEVRVNDYVMTEAPYSGRTKVFVRVKWLTKKSVVVEFPANEAGHYCGPFYQNSKWPVVGMKEWTRQSFLKLSDEQLVFARVNRTEWFYDSQPYGSP